MEVENNEDLGECEKVNEDDDKAEPTYELFFYFEYDSEEVVSDYADSNSSILMIMNLIMMKKVTSRMMKIIFHK